MPFHPLQGRPCWSVSYQMCCLPEESCILYSNPSVVFLGFKVGGQPFDHVFGVRVMPSCTGLVFSECLCLPSLLAASLRLSNCRLVRPHRDLEKLDQASVGGHISSLLIISPRSVWAVKEVFALPRLSRFLCSLSRHALGASLHITAHSSSFSTSDITFQGPS